MSAPEKDEILEQYACEIGMSELEMIEFCKLTLEDKGYTITKDDSPDSHMTDYQRFTHDMDANGFEVREYRGRNFWKGPSVTTDERNGPTFQEICGATKVKLQRDNMGLDFIVYPAAREDSWR